MLKTNPTFNDPCSAYNPKAAAYEPCANGFPQTMACAGRGQFIGVPICCQEEICGRRYEQWGGRPSEIMVESGRRALAEQAGGGDE